MGKAVDRGMTIEYIRLTAKSGGKSRSYVQAGDCVMPKEGIFAIVLEGGRIAVGERLR